MPKKIKYRVCVIRTAKRSLNIEVEASSMPEAKKKALKDAPNYLFSSEMIGCQYTVDHVKVVKGP